MAVYRDHDERPSSKSHIVFGIATSISKEFERISTIAFSCNISDQLRLFRGCLERFISDTVYIATRLRIIRTHLRDMTMICLLLLFLACWFVYRAIRAIFSSPDRDVGPENYGNYSMGRTTLYCETCYRSGDVDSTGWCHKCERFPLRLVYSYLQTMSRTLSLRGTIFKW